MPDPAEFTRIMNMRTAAISEGVTPGVRGSIWEVSEEYMNSSEKREDISPITPETVTAVGIRIPLMYEETCSLLLLMLSLSLRWS
ncbi:MAG: hypothetical protein QXQ33_03200, partial [Nitrososphaerota archaeon]